MFRKRWRWGVVSVLLTLLLAHVFLFHHVRGERIDDPSAERYEISVTRLYRGPITVRSIGDMLDLGTVASRIADEAALTQGSFYVHFLPQLDFTEKLRHFLHSPFTGLDSIYADIWFNSCTAYGVSEPTWGIRKSRVHPADKLSVLILLIDRMQRGKSDLQEHLGAYIEVFSGMPVHSLPGRARCWALLLKQCARDDMLADFVEHQLVRRRAEGIDLAERQFWDYLAKQPTRNALEVLAASDGPPIRMEHGNTVGHQYVFKELLAEYRLES